jgi:hypothetical protein
VTSLDSSGDRVSLIVDRYQKVLERWDAAQADASKANVLFDEAHSLAKELRQTPEGRLGIQALMAHPIIGVRLMAAADSLPFDADQAIPVLESIEAGPGLHAVSAKYTIRMFRAGKLNFDW